jgi:hypothetical protein
MSTATETMTGEGKWRVTWQNHQVAMIEIWRDENTLITFGQRDTHGPCALCGTDIPTITDENVECALCERCQSQVQSENE